MLASALTIADVVSELSNAINAASVAAALASTSMSKAAIDIEYTKQKQEKLKNMAVKKLESKLHPEMHEGKTLKSARRRLQIQRARSATLNHGKTGSLLAGKLKKPHAAFDDLPDVKPKRRVTTIRQRLEVLDYMENIIEKRRLEDEFQGDDEGQIDTAAASQDEDAPTEVQHNEDDKSANKANKKRNHTGRSSKDKTADRTTGPKHRINGINLQTLCQQKFPNIVANCSISRWKDRCVALRRTV